jgi:SAM-dependent methyltransferase
MSAIPIEQPEVLSASELRALLLRYRKENWQGIQTPEWQERIVDDILNDEGVSILRRLSDFWQMPTGALILDVGSGVGSFVVGCRRQGLLAFGIEPDRIARGGRLTSIQIARRRLKGRVFAAALGEKLPFPDRSFDLVTMNQVIEHVGDQAAVLREALRVTRDGGAVYIACPNYLRFYEPHYKIFWLPLLPKTLGRWYLKLRGRNPVLLDQLTYTTNNRLRAMISRLGADYTIIDLHREQFLRKCSDLSFTSRRAQFVAKAARVPGLGRLIIWATLLFLRATEGGCEMMILSQQRSTNISC